MRRFSEEAGGAVQLGVLALLSACFSGSLLQDPKPVAPGRVRAAVGAEYGTHSMTPTASLRIGVAPRIEVRGKLAALGGELGGNVHAVDGDNFDLLLMPHAFVYDVDDISDEENGARLVGFGLPAVASVSFDTKRAPTQLFVAPDIRAGRRDTYSGTYGFGAMGVHVGLGISGRRDYATFIPECAWFMGAFGPRATREDVAVQRFFARSEHSLSCSIGVGFGSPRDLQAPAPSPPK